MKMPRLTIVQREPVSPCHPPLASLTRVLPQEPGRVEYYNQFFCLCGHLGGVSEIQTSLDVLDL